MIQGKTIEEMLRDALSWFCGETGRGGEVEVKGLNMNTQASDEEFFKKSNSMQLLQANNGWYHSEVL